jgi:hypothetical protein
LGLAGANSVCRNFRDHGFAVQKSTLANPVVIAADLPNRRGWKKRFHQDLWYDCEDGEIEAMKWRKAVGERKFH